MFNKIWDEYLETRLNSGEDFLEWLIKRKMTWGMRWILVIFLVIGYRFFIIDVRNMFYLIEGAVVMGMIYGLINLVTKKTRNRKK